MLAKRILITIVSCLFAVAAHGTAQEPDVIVLDGQSFMLHSNPLEEYFAAHPDKRHPRDPPEDGNYATSTALWRGYVATFGFEGGVMVLEKLETLNPRSFEDGQERMLSSINDYFPTPESRICTWYSGLLVLPHGELRAYVHMGYGSIYEHQVLLRIKDGRIVDRADFTYEEYLDYKRRLFKLYMQSPEYEEAISEYRDFTNQSMDGVEFDIDQANQFLFDAGGWERFVELEFE